MQNNRIVIAATKSGSGKTTITCGLLKALSIRGKKVAAFKCGPDYIDPMFHSEIVGVPSKNLDLFFTEEERTKELFLKNNDSDISVIEGVMGLYDGLGGVSETASTYHLAKTLQAPIILVINAHGMGRSILAEIKGFLDYDQEHLIKGVILNCVSGSFFSMMKPLIEEEAGIKVFGCFERQKETLVESRYLGLKLPGEINNLKEGVTKIAQELEQTVSIDDILALASTAPMLSCNLSKIDKKTEKQIRIAVAFDEAFCFYYKDNLSLLEENGAQLNYFSPIHDEKLPENVQGLILGGGYPELYVDALAKNESMKRSILQALEKGMPSLAECGGFMYLHQGIRTKEGISYPMVGAIEGECSYQGKLVRFGYLSIEDINGEYEESGKHIKIRGHEFHYFDSENNGSDGESIKPVTGKKWKSAHIDKNHWWGFAHLYYPSNIDLVKSFVKKCWNYE